MQIPSLLYLVSKIFWRIIQPGDLLILLLGLGFVLLFTRRNRLGIAVYRPLSVACFKHCRVAHRALASGAAGASISTRDGYAGSR